MRTKKTTRLFLTGFALTVPLLVALYIAFATPSNTEAMEWVLIAGLPGVPGMICLVLWAIAVSRPSLAEDTIPTDAKGRPDLSSYDKPLSHYEAMYADWLEVASGKKTEPKGRALAHRKRAHALWGVISKGTDGIPFVTSLLCNPMAEAQADGMYLYHELSKDEPALETLLKLQSRPWTLDSLVALVTELGDRQARQALPLLARLIRDPATEPTAQQAAIAALAKITGQAFPDPSAAREWVSGNVESEAL